MTKDEFIQHLREESDDFCDTVATDNGDWIIKGFIDVTQQIYTISQDTKVISKVLELQLLPKMKSFADRHSLAMQLAERQNHYPDVTFTDDQGNRFAVDLKSTYRTPRNKVNGMTLGAFTGYFRKRDTTKNITFSYNSYAAHIVLGVIYSKVDAAIDERQIYSIKDLGDIASVIRDFQFFVQEKYKIASDRPGSGNTKNIGSVKEIIQLVEGTGPFAERGLEIFDDYWIDYLTKDMARAADLSEPPYTNLEDYLSYKNLNAP